MDPVLTHEQIQAIQANPVGPVRVIDPKSATAYVIVRADVFEQMSRILKDDYQISDTYLAQVQSAWHAGWNDPAMDDYNNYDESLKKLCQ